MHLSKYYMSISAMYVYHLYRSLFQPTFSLLFQSSIPFCMVQLKVIHEAVLNVAGMSRTHSIITWLIPQTIYFIQNINLNFRKHTFSCRFPYYPLLFYNSLDFILSAKQYQNSNILACSSEIRTHIICPKKTRNNFPWPYNLTLISRYESLNAVISNTENHVG